LNSSAISFWITERKSILNWIALPGPKVCQLRESISAGGQSKRNHAEAEDQPEQAMHVNNTLMQVKHCPAWL
jgi:hypothetical protein